MANGNENTDADPALTAAAGSMRCEGWRRSGGAFSLGPIEWSQCENDGTVMLKLDQGGEISELPACQHCWTECLETDGIEVLEARPLLWANESALAQPERNQIPTA